MNNRLDKVIQAETLPGGSASTADNHSRIEDKARTEPHDISILERRVFALETFLGSSSNTLNIEAAGTQHGGLGLGSQEDSGTISGSGTLPLIDSISRWQHNILHIFLRIVYQFVLRHVTVLPSYQSFLDRFRLVEIHIFEFYLEFSPILLKHL